MTVLYIIKTLLNDPIIQSYLISCGASASWDAMKFLGKKGDDTLENQLYLEKHNEIITIVDKSEYQKLMNFINREDPKAFVTIYNVSSVQYQPKT